MAAPRKPDHLHLLTGTRPAGKPPAPVAATVCALEKLPAAPTWMVNRHAIAAWKEHGQGLVERGTLTSSALAALGQLCALEGALRTAWAAGEIPTGALLSAHRLMANDFGLTPASSGRVPQVAPKPSNRFSNNGVRSR